MKERIILVIAIISETISGTAKFGIVTTIDGDSYYDNKASEQLPDASNPFCPLFRCPT